MTVRSRECERTAQITLLLSNSSDLVVDILQGGPEYDGPVSRVNADGSLPKE
jgi:hypothetical protein